MKSKLISKATVITLSGDLGAGKTHFTKNFGKAIGIKEIINSPTYVIIKNYKISKRKSSFENLVHIDAYRLESYKELERLGWQEILENPKNIVVIEWPEMVSEIIPKNAIMVSWLK